MDLDPDTLYIALSARNEEGSYHWGLVLPLTRTTCIYYHATFGSETGGKWESRFIEQPLPMRSRALIMLWKVGAIHAKSNSINDELVKFMGGISADGSPSKRTGRDFNCRVWVMDSLAKLGEESLVPVALAFDEIEATAFEHANSVENEVVKGERGPLVVNDDAIARM
ncbi:hypothetical protein BJ875DRAFT_498066 [Amylocarpus encephaloides]|uniref:Uncharacterized protein n=1 Tax=Amylocarpus encephaloides TaxID=45428 RepID=A0A9P7YES8_9HELO|nr:hypothetical protein BJ875DRAFT_498066 [Amylocarpus encephaloides]